MLCLTYSDVPIKITVRLALKAEKILNVQYIFIGISIPTNVLYILCCISIHIYPIMGHNSKILDELYQIASLQVFFCTQNRFCIKGTFCFSQTVRLIGTVHKNVL